MRKIVSEHFAGTRGGTRYFPPWARSTFATLSLMGALTTSSHAQAPPLGTIANFAIMAGTGITNTGPSVITGTAAHPGDLGTSTATITGFPPGIVVFPGVIRAPGD